MDDNRIQVSVLCLAYNQAQYIEKTLQGFINQKTSFNFEIIVHDDASTDGTTAIIERYVEKYPHLFTAILQKKNQYSQGVHILEEYLFPKVKGRYIAFCEGDDYWCDSGKLQAQYDALERNPNCSFSTHITRKIQIDGKDLNDCFPAIRLKEGVVDSKRLLHIELVEHPWLFQTSSFFIRQEVYKSYIINGKEYSNFFPVGDKPLLLYCFISGDCYFINHEMSKYRTSAGVLNKISLNTERQITFNERFIQGYKAFNEFTKSEYKDDVEYRIQATQVEILKILGRYNEILSTDYRAVFRKMNIQWKCIVLLSAVDLGLAKKIVTWLKKHGK